MNPVSVVASISNEAEYIEEAFRLLAPHVDDFVVVDQGSADRTVEIARQFTDKIYLFPRVYYSYAYIHHGALMARNDWILKCDPDERWDSCLLDNLGKYIAGGHDIIKFRMEYWGERKSFNPRLFRKSKVLWTDSLDARPYNEETLDMLEVDDGIIKNLRSYQDSLDRYRLEGAKRLLARYGDTDVPFYKTMVAFYKKLTKKES